MLWHPSNIRRTSTSRWKRLRGEHQIRAVYGIIGALLILAIVGLATYWWSSIPHAPKRPAVVPKDAVWIPKHKSGKWILCAVKEYGDKAQCTFWDYSGNLVYEGDFRTYKESPLSPNRRLDIDTLRTGEPEVFIHDAFIPVIYLTDHKSLIPAEAYAKVIEDFKGSL
jgi:hypothetical protein